ncbi:MAG: glycosyltransferase [Patescibacteria group bacterium]|nr:glycosyltransferase [Patescibacteria group bacterium]MDD5490980.1 glycosyltransferase [Patescibacteria group bacterium]
MALKIALVHDHLTQEGGAEKVLRVLHEIFPAAPIFTLIYNPKTVGQDFAAKDIRTSFLQNIPGAKTKYQWLLPLMPAATESYNLADYDVVLSSSSALAKGVITQPRTLHVCYCHTPTRYLWSDTHKYIEELSYNRLVKKAMPIVLNRLRSWDRLAADRVDKFIANSETVRQRIQKYYNKPSEVIHPPVETKKFYISKNIGNYYLAGGRLVPYKRFDVIIEAFNRLGLPLKIFGEGRDFEKLKERAKPNIKFLGAVSFDELRELYSQCLAYLHPQEEDFGITAVEAMASGRPVIAYKAGGALETVVPGLSGEFFDEQIWEELGDKIIRFQPEKYNPEQIKKYAEQFDTENFKTKIRNFVQSSLEQKII